MAMKNKIFENLKSKLGKIIPEAELYIKAELAAEIEELKREKNAVILGHNYMEAALYQTIPDFKGDSLELARKAAETDKDIIVFCGVRFMAETAKLLNPTKTVLVPAKKAGCSLAESITAEDVRALRKKYPGVPVVSYVNTYADVKAESDICCTSGNAARVVESLNSDTVIFLPDEYLAANVAKETGKKLITWHGKCEVHEKFTVEDIQNVRKQFPDTVILAHPECSPEVVSASDFSQSTSKMISYVKESKASRYLLLTECSMGDNIAAENPDKEMLRLCSIRCPHMNEITLEETRDALKYHQYEIFVPQEIQEKARRAVERMIAI